MGPSSNFEDEEQTDSGVPVFPRAPTLPNLLNATRVLPDLGLLNAVLQDFDVTEIMVNDLRNIAIERRGQIVVTPIRFKTLEELNRVVRLLLEPSGKVLTPENPMATSSLPDGSRVHVVGPPVTEFGPCITIRRFPRRYSVENFLANGTLDKRMAHFLNACVVGKQNILLSGGTGTGQNHDSE